MNLQQTDGYTFFYHPKGPEVTLSERMSYHRGTKGSGIETQCYSAYVDVKRMLTLSLISSSIGLFPHSMRTISLACPGTAYENGVPIPGEALDLSHKHTVKAYSSGRVFLIFPYKQFVRRGRDTLNSSGDLNALLPRITLKKKNVQHQTKQYVYVIQAGKRI